MLVEGETPVDKVKRDADLLAAEEEEEEEDEVGAWPWLCRGTCSQPSTSRTALSRTSFAAAAAPRWRDSPSLCTNWSRRCLRKAGARDDFHEGPVPRCCQIVTGPAAV